MEPAASQDANETASRTSQQYDSPFQSIEITLPGFQTIKLIPSLGSAIRATTTGTGVNRVLKISAVPTGSGQPSPRLSLTGIQAHTEITTESEPPEHMEDPIKIAYKDHEIGYLESGDLKKLSSSIETLMEHNGQRNYSEQPFDLNDYTESAITNILEIRNSSCSIAEFIELDSKSIS